MKIRFRRLLPLGLLLLYFPTGAAAAAPLAVGDAVPVIIASDQHGEAFQFTNGIRFLLVVTEMTPAKLANRRLTTAGAGFLEQHNAAYLMDIHTMPAIAEVA